jgi:hypothetical protein
MDTADQGQEPLTEIDDDDNDLETQRSIIRRSLDQIAHDVGIAMRDAGLDFPLGLTVPRSRESLITMITPGEPSDADWTRATRIVCQIITEVLGGTQLRSHELDCVVANGTMTAAEITTNALACDLPS